METKSKKHEAAQEFMLTWQADTGKLPLVLGIELYEYFGQCVQIVEASVGGYVVIEERFGERKEVELAELSLKKRR